MSYRVTAEIRSRIVGHAVKKAILLVMADTANHDGSDIWLSKPTIASETEYGVSTIKKHMRELVAIGKNYKDFKPILVETGKRRISNGFTNIYRIDLAAVRGLPLSKVLDITTGSPLAPVKSAVGAEVTPTGSRGAPDTGHEVPPNSPKQSYNSPPPNPQGGIEDIFEKLWKRVIEITPPDILTRHKKKYALGKFEKIVTRKKKPISASRIANAVPWFYASHEQTKKGGEFMSGLGPVLNSENFAHFLDRGVYDRAVTKEDKKKANWQIRADYVNWNAGEWPSSAPSPQTCPAEYRELFDKKYWEDLGWEK